MSILEERKSQIAEKAERKLKAQAEEEAYEIAERRDPSEETGKPRSGWIRAALDGGRRPRISTLQDARL